MTRTVLITGANRGIGLSLTAYFLNKGDHVIAAARNPDGAPELKSLAGDFGPRMQLETIDIASDLSVKALSMKLVASGVVDILINNAGIIGERETPFTEVSLKDVANTISVNAIGSMRVTQAMMPLLKKSKMPIVASITSKMGSIADNTSGGYYGYRMSKAALNMFNKSLSCDYPDMISVVFHPGWVQTDMGGKSAPVQVSDSGNSLGKIIDRLTKADNGKFFDFRDYEISW